MKDKLKILFVEDVRRDAELIWRELEKNDIVFEKLLVENKKDFLKGLKNFIPDLIISDYSLPQFNGMKALLIRNEVAALTPFILVTGSMNEEVAVECMKAGADDYILKDNLVRLGSAVKNALNKAELLQKKDDSENALRESEERYRLLVEKSPDAIAVHREGKFIYINQAGVKLIGAKSPQDLLGTSIINIVHPDSRKDVIDRLHREEEGEDVPLFEEKFVKLDGSVIDVEVIGIPVIYQGQNSVQVIVRDISQRKRAEEAIKQSKKEFQDYFESGSVGMSVTLPDMKWIEVNQALCRMFGYTKGELTGMTWIELSHPEDIEVNLNFFRDALDGKINNYELEKRFISKDGKVVYVAVSTVCERNSDETVHHFLTSYTDITERVLADEKFQHERILLRTLIDNLPDPIYVLDKNSRKVIANIADVNNIGARSEEEVLGKTDLELFPGQTGVRGHANNMEVINSGKGIFEREEDFVDKDGKKRWLLTTMIPLRNKDGIITGLVGIGHDITQRKKNESELIIAKEKAEESDRLKTAFLHNISHEIRTPMNAIVGFSALLSEPGTDELSHQSYIDTIMQSSNHLLAIITDIVDISNIEANLVKLTVNDININDTLKSIYNQFLPLATEKKINLDFKSALPVSEGFIKTDSTKLTQILSNLINNALKFTDEGLIKVTLEKKDRFLQFSVSDTGIGIPEGHQDRIFERFYQVRNSISRIYEGTGLGLAISKAYVELMGGKIWLDSQQGSGSTFYFTIPFEKQVATVIPVAVKSTSGSLVFKEKKRILVAEDIDSNYKLITYFLLGANTELLRAVNGREAVDKCISTKNIDLVLMDVKMPEMDGYTAVKLIREANIKIPIIAQTAYADDRDKAFSVGCDGFISKPFDKKGLLKVLSEFL